MPRYKCIVEYEGTAFNGWQRQPNVPSVQQALEEAIKGFSGQEVDIVCSGRTDAGVHAIGQVFHVDLDKEWPIESIIGGTNFHVRPAAIALSHAERVDDDFHARFSAKKRFYCYKIVNRRAPVILRRDRVWHVPVPLDVDAMREAAAHLVGEHDFSSLRDSECQAKSPMKTLDEITISQKADEIHIEVSAQSFLHHMVRNITGTLKLVGEGKWSPDYMPEMLEAKDRTKAGPTAPACGLYFMRVEY
jgi:tRNA pseudouridine38-40 synthase